MTATRNNIENVIFDIAMENVRMYPENYEVVDGKFTEEAAIHIQEVARGYWENRSEEEVERDENAGVDLEDYAIWVGDAARCVMIEE